MGAAKAGVELGGRPLIAYPTEAIAGAGLEPVVVAKPGSALPALDCRVIRERDPAVHPAAGILAALRANAAEPVVVVPCDMPFVPSDLVAHLAGLDAPAALASLAGRLQPLLARYSQSAVPVLEAAIKRGEALRDAIGALHPLILRDEDLARFGEPERIAFNVNDRDDLAEAERLMAVAHSR
jgi:molybdopterin-guanine dinucleotide biosynthesis protein A